jgi:3'-phosphoadenosine 5'-phosphosulfate sulfotransferase (PAPS reductase)/FAD synthetase
MPLWMKIKYTENRIKAWHEHYDGDVYVAFSGGKDSTVLLDICRRLYPDIVAVFSDTGLEYPEIRKFVKSIDNVVWIKPKMNFKEVIDKYGYPVISKEVSRDISVVRNKPDGITAQKFKRDSEHTIRYGQRYCIEKYAYLIKAPFKISCLCCDMLKKGPFHNYEKATNLKPIIGTMASDSNLRKTNYLKTGCNAFGKRPSSTPMSFWLESDIWEYIKQHKIPYSSIYDMGYTRTGCMFCMFGIHLEKGLNRFQRMSKTHPKMYNYCINDLGLGKVMDYIGVKYEIENDLFTAINQ